MHRSVPLAALLFAIWTTPAGARPPASGEFDPSIPVPEKHAVAREPRAGTTGAGGEDFGTAIEIQSLPFEDQNSTCGYGDDYTPACTFLTGAPDVVYVYTPPADACVDVDLCGSGFDTALHVYDGGPGQPAACNDDYCGNASRVSGLHLSGGHPYYIVVDGWSTACGSYRLRVAECPPPCPLPNPSSALFEGEPVCRDGYYDVYNTGCNDYPYSFTDIPCSETATDVRGTYGTWIYGPEEFRDTDWYRIVLSQPTRLLYRVTGGTATQIAILDGRRGCEDYSVVCDAAGGEACETVSCDVEVASGTYFLFVAPSHFIGVECGTPYILHLEGQPDAALGARASTWSAVKTRYR